jgi:thiol-disulfide isomerase/thioredoxin
LTKQREPAGDWQDLGITIGNPNAANTLIKVCSPFCGPCSDMHSRLDRLLEHNDNVKLKIIFLTNQDSEDRRAVVASHILAIAEHSSMSTIMQALDDWYLPSSKDYPSFAKKYPVNGELAKQDTKILAMNNWCKKADIAHTPTLLLNGYPVPEEYTVEDLAYLF